MPDARYRLIRTIATGGMAHVYEAVAAGERGFERRVAIKRVLPELAQDESMRRMFFDEAQIASQLHHGNIVQVLDYGLVDGSEFIAMEYVDGLDARRAARRGGKRGEPLSEALALHVIAEVAYALAYAHEKTSTDGAPLGIVHRDVSPQNILLSWDGDVKLSDFGIASSFDKEEQTATGVVKGKLSYMPPEQFAGSKVDGRADVYALGASLHAMLTGSAPMSDATMLPGRLAGAPLVLSDALSSEVAELITRCMAHDRADRPSGDQLAAEAGRLASQRLARDARGALRQWMSTLRPPRQKRGQLDDLTGLCLMMTEDRQFTVSREPTVREASQLEPTASETDTLSDRSTTIRKPSRLAYAGMVLLGIPTVVVGSWALWNVAQPEPTDVPSTPAAAEHSPIEPEQEPTVEPSALVEPVVARAEPEEEPAARPRMTMRTSRVRPPATEMNAMNTMATVAATGWIRVSHPRGSGPERVFVDGRPVGYTPNLFRVSLGTHEVEVRSVATGETAARHSVAVRADHVRGSPSVMPR